MTTNPIHTKRQGPFPCKGVKSQHHAPLPLTGCQGRMMSHPHPVQPHLTPTQAEWMKANKPLYFTGWAINDLPHLPQELRFV